MSQAAPILLDTCAALWLGEGRLSEKAEAELSSAISNGVSILVSPITAWEVGLLVSRGRLHLRVDPLAWFDILTTRVGVAPMQAGILVSSSFLPAGPLRDPADRIIAATARHLGCRLMTRDRPLLDYAEAGHLQAIAC